uniref:Uncharacterized protein n=1 Tax=Meloidogyne javanica TaxID=6303 RepID=A0A915LPL4_MELJA
MLKQTKINNKSRRIILASNAPPFHLEEVRKDYPVKQRLQQGQFSIKNVKSEGDIVRMEKGLISRIGKESTIQNHSARKWIIKQSSGGLVSAVEPVMENNKENVWVFHATASNSNLPSEDDPKLQAIEEHKSKSAFGLRSVLIDDETYHYYYEDISNCILWPALHNIQENITVHDNERVFNEAINGGCDRPQSIGPLKGLSLHITGPGSSAVLPEFRVIG